jgi:hypothetical protein
MEMRIQGGGPRRPTSWGRFTPHGGLGSGEMPTLISGATELLEPARYRVERRCHIRDRRLVEFDQHEVQPPCPEPCSRFEKSGGPFRRVGLFDLGENPWHETAFRTVAAALAKLTEQPAG